jgi:hypothetical protein
LGLQNQPYLPARQWQLQASFQYVNTDEFYVGSQRNDAAGPLGQAPHRVVSLLNVDVLYGLTNRFSVDLTIPFLTGSGQWLQGTAVSPKLYHFDQSGLGDVSIQAEYWVLDPTKPSRVKGSMSVGIKAPTGKYKATALQYSPQGDVEKPIDEAVQLGNGGWEILFRAQGTAVMAGPLFGYASAYYGLSLTEHANVLNGTVLRGVPDTYSARLGVAYLLRRLAGLVLSAGGRINGVTVRDVIGGGDLYWRRPGYEVYFEPGVTWTGGKNTMSASVPLRVYQNKLDSLLDKSLNRHVGADFAHYLLLVSYARRF